MKPAAIDLPQVAVATPLVSVPFVASVLGASTKRVFVLLSRRELGPAWNVALGGSRAEVRILARELARFQSGRKAKPFKSPSLVAAVFPDVPAARPGIMAKVRATVVASRLGVSGGHILNLVRAGRLEMTPGATCRRGPIGSPELRFTSVVAFMEGARFI